jgi:hypothetical protein
MVRASSNALRTLTKMSMRSPYRFMACIALFAVVLSCVAVLAGPTSPAAACIRLYIPRLAVDRCVVQGGQAAIDAGNVVEFTTLTGGSVVWVAAHRSSHGSSFAALPGLVNGDYVQYRESWYRIAEMRLVDRTAPDVSDYYNTSSPRLVLQTSKAGTTVYTWRADPSSAPPATPVSVTPITSPRARWCTATLRFNTRSAAVRELQIRLRTLGWYTSRVDGWFYLRTKAALRNLQLAHGITPTGTVTSATRSVLGCAGVPRTTQF